MISDYDRTHIADILAGEGDWFTAHLIRLIPRADAKNREKLRLAFPEEVATFEKWSNS